MEKGTQQKITDHLKDWPNYAVRCKGCNGLHRFKYMEQVSFPKRDFSIIDVVCSESGEWYRYTLRELIIYPKSNTKPDLEIENRLAKLELRIQALENKTAELPEKDGIKELKKEIKDEFTGFLADASVKQKA